MPDPTDPRAVADDPSGIVQQMPEGGDEALKPCPFCGCDNVVIFYDHPESVGPSIGGGFYISHPLWMDYPRSWGRQAAPNNGYFQTEREAIVAWNRRATEADLRAEVERLNALADLRAQHAAWSQAQFGDVSAVGPAKHLAKEAMEVAADPRDPIEHADCWMLLWDMQRRAGISDAQLAEAIREKLAINQARRWPAPKEGEAREHDRAALSPETDGGQDGR